MNTTRTSGRALGRDSLHGQEIISVPSQRTILRFRQCAASPRRGCCLESEKKPLLALLEENIECFQRYLAARDEGGKVLFQDAARWIFEEAGDWSFSFENVCKQLGRDPVSLREELLQWKTTMLSEALPCQVLSLNCKQRAQRQIKTRESAA